MSLPDPPVSTSRESTPRAAEITSLSVVMARLVWIALGPFALLLAIWGIIANGAGWLTGVDLCFALIIAAMLGSRWFEHRSGTSTTLDGLPATDEQWRRYLVMLPLIGAGVWITANVVGNHLLA